MLTFGIINSTFILGGCTIRKNDSIKENTNEINSSISAIESTQQQLIPRVEEKKDSDESKKEIQEVNIQNSVAFLTNSSNLRNENGEIITEIDEYQKVIVLKDSKNFFVDGKYRKYIHVQVPNIGDGYIIERNLSLIEGTYIEVDISDQKLYLYKNGEIVFVSNVITGNPAEGNDTDLGYTVAGKIEHNVNLQPFNRFVHTFIPVNLEEGIHDADWRTDNEYGQPEYYKYNGSHGCINMKKKDIDELEKKMDDNTMVLIHK